MAPITNLIIALRRPFRGAKKRKKNPVRPEAAAITKPL
jgi:hypothetical protein